MNTKPTILNFRRSRSETLRRLQVLTLTIALISTASGHAEYYTFTDDQGNLHYTDNPSSLPDKARHRARRIDVDMGPEKQTQPPSAANAEEIEPEMKKPAAKRARRAIGISGAPPASAGQRSLMQPVEQPVARETAGEAPDPALSTPLKTIRLFRRSLASGNYAAAAKCLRIDDVREVQAFLSQIPRELAVMLSEEFSEAVEIVRDDDHAVYMIGDPRKQGNRIMRRHEVSLEKVGQNWKIAH